MANPAATPRTHEPSAAAWTAELLAHGLTAKTVAEWLPPALERVASSTAAEQALFVVAVAGEITIRAACGPQRGVPRDVVAECLDRDAPVAVPPWHAFPVVAEQGSRCVLLLAGAKGQQVPSLGREAAAAMSLCLIALAGRQAHAARLERLEAVLEIIQRWNQSQDVATLLQQMAEAATRLFAADRASIFLWDRPGRTLVGRPALGVKEGELRIADDRGVVGQVVQSGVARRVDAALEPREIDRKVDHKLGYETRNLLCVPLRSPTGEMLGAFELINKLEGSFTAEEEAGLSELAAHAAVALANVQDRERLLQASRQMTAQAAAQVRLIGDSPPMAAIRSIVSRLADTDLALLIQGENGTGKEVIAQSVHYLSHRRDEPFVAVNCAAIPDTLAESELFGHEKGAFTDARESRPGKFELAGHGTLFLDEIGDLSLAGQAKLLRVLEERVIVRVGGSRPIATHARVVTATNQNLAEMVVKKRFREDLFYRLNVVAVDLPPLRSRGDDILLLADYFLQDFCRKARRRPPTIAAEARHRLLEHSWPGNVRELRNLMERLAYLTTGDTIEPADLALQVTPGIRGGSLPEILLERPLGEATNEFQREYVRRMIEAAGGNMSLAASRLGLHRSNLYRKMAQLGMPTS